MKHGVNLYEEWRLRLNAVPPKSVASSHIRDDWKTIIADKDYEVRVNKNLIRRREVRP